MGGAVSTGRNNDDLIDNLLEADYIKSSLIERVFRAVDRAEYFLPEARSGAYKDLAWKNGNLHLSAPCIYSEVMEGLCLEPGLSFLNIGSGTGYISTMVGLVLGINGINHGIEIHEDVIQYANKKLEEFKKYSGAIDEYDFCEPKFVQGNCLCLTSDCTKLYDRIYCGAACPEDYEAYMKNLLKVGGILVVPINESLLQIKRVSEMEWTNRTLLPVSFASLVPPRGDTEEWVGPIEVEPLSLQVLCRGVIRSILRKIIEKEHLPVPKPPPIKAPKKKRALRRLVIPLFESDDSSEEERQHHVRLGGERNRDAGRATFLREDDYILSLFLGIRGRQGAGERGDRTGTGTTQNQKKTDTTEEPMETDSSIEDSSDTRNKDSQEVQAVIEHHPDSKDNQNAMNEPSRRPSLETFNEIGDVISECLNVLRRERGGSVENQEDILSEDEDNVSNREDKEARQSDAQHNWPTTSGGKKNNKREKFDSGLGDEIIETQDSSDDDERMKLDTISSCDEDPAEKRNKRDTSSSDNDDDTRPSKEMHMYKSPYTEQMAIKIQQLPLPPILKKYLNFLRDL
ncbi:protein-L-isoaspartate O-methyltransferase domain-containing protein 1-like isoform X2 [Cylas formicarius]|uniref:protein-L-isoaspartate O-methyltransferase domain-containing protein 1-like isoform X2 n=1 Tax=Cylas formicarius TaxID=197179 RepID=UPI0029584156|nr:protein-L-isoaspartate O-methyltransferase domain-containing protein 1-like isoform X2 [Cylas formicarius]